MQGKQESEARRLGSKVRMLKAVLWECGAGQHLVFVLCLLWATKTSVRAHIKEQQQGGSNTLLLERLAFPQVFVLWIAIVTQGFKPFLYAIQASWRWRGREECLFPLRDYISARYPSTQAIDQCRLRSSQVFSYVILFYALGMFALSLHIGTTVSNSTIHST